MREIIMGAQDNLTNVLAVVLGAAIVAAAIPLGPFAVLPLQPAAVAAAVLSVAALFALGFWTGGVTRKSRWGAGARFVLIGGLAALGSALVGTALQSHAV